MNPADPADAASIDFLARARATLSLRVPDGLTDPNYVPRRGDLDNEESAALAMGKPIRPAAVLVPIVERSEPMVLLTQRAAHLRDHAGQISFPGGKIDAADKSPLAAALREAEEEIGLDPALVSPVGYLDIYMTRFGFRILPVVATVRPTFTLTLNVNEVDDAFEVPLAFLMAPENHQRQSREWNGATRHFYAMPFGERYIWGVTAGIVRNLYERIGPE